MNLTALKYFVEVAKMMSFTHAAEKMYISQQSISIHIKRLEEEYHVKLFERKPALKLTEAGQILLQAARQMLAANEELTDRLDLIQNSFYGTVTIGIPPNRTSAFATDFIPVFVKKFPNMSVSFVEKTSTLLLRAVQQNEVDIALLLIPNALAQLDPLIYQTIPLADEPLFLVISDDLLQKYFPDRYPSCKETFKAGVCLEDFYRVPMFLRPSSSHIHREIVDDMVSMGHTPNILVQSTNTGALIPLCAHGYGIAFCTPMILSLFQREYPDCFKRLNIFSINGFEKRRKMVLVYHREKYLGTPIRESVAMIQDIFNKGRISDL